MSGGHFDYIQHRIDDVADDIDRLIERNTEKDEWGYSYDFSKETIEKFKEAAETVRRASKMVQRVDWLVSGDDGEETFHERWRENVDYAPYGAVAVRRTKEVNEESDDGT